MNFHTTLKNFCWWILRSIQMICYAEYCSGYSSEYVFTSAQFHCRKTVYIIKSHLLITRLSYLMSSHWDYNELACLHSVEYHWGIYPKLFVLIFQNYLINYHLHKSYTDNHYAYLFQNHSLSAICLLFQLLCCCS